MVQFYQQIRFYSFFLSHIDHCTRRRNTIGHFRDLIASLKDAKQYYDLGKASLQKTKRALLSVKRDIDKDIKHGK